MSTYIIIYHYITVYTIISQYMSANIIICHYIQVPTIVSQYMSTYIIMCHYIQAYASLCQKMPGHSRNVKLEGTSTAVWLQASSASISYLAVYYCGYQVHAESYLKKDFSTRNVCMNKRGCLLDSSRTCGPT